MGLQHTKIDLLRKIITGQEFTETSESKFEFDSTWRKYVIHNHITADIRISI